MPTNPSTKRKRYLAAGHFHEGPGYRVERPAGCHDWLLIYTVSGKGLFSDTQGSFLAAAHDVILIPPHVPHHYEVAPEANHWELLWAHFLPISQWRTWLKWPTLTPGWGHVRLENDAVCKQLIGRMEEVVQFTAGYRPHREPLALNALEAVLIGCHEQVVHERGEGIDPRIGDVLDHICRHLEQPLRIEDLARQCHLSPSRFAHLFRQQMEMTPVQFIEQQRIERACEMLEHTGYPITAIAQQVGFENAFYFSRRFKRAKGISPRAYRRQAV
ncbi:arabinose operon transcriptional regulator AraC [Bremerella cremea]|uniref:Arabinose operon transcriptional regulator AraC n=1 Tax=Bremerella cremea TaxID=1031537 RepID=A0A368KL87_9BACT|nr:arabinose operon transcriptional regulator AraC [Bremerella cremea]RCS41509.1 arabinose operon transcriptional regulator AraC [Bremerella cremea]